MSSRCNNSVFGRAQEFNGRVHATTPACVVPGIIVVLILILTLTLVVGFSSAAFAQGGAEPNGVIATPPDVKPKGLENVGVEQHLGEQLPLDLPFRDESGRAVRLGDYFGSKPVVLSFVYYRCPMLCPELLVGLESALKILRFNVGDEFEVITVSIDPRDTPELAAAKKTAILSRYKRPGAEAGWHFLTGSEESIHALTRTVGFGYEYDEKNGQFAHATAIMVATPTGKLAQYFYGVDFPPRDLRLSIIQASSNKIGNLADAVILYCFHYDPVTGRYNALIGRVLELAAGFTVLSLAGMLLFLFHRGPDHQHRRQTSS